MALEIDYVYLPPQEPPHLIHTSRFQNRAFFRSPDVLVIEVRLTSLNMSIKAHMAE